MASRRGTLAPLYIHIMYNFVDQNVMKKERPLRPVSANMVFKSCRLLGLCETPRKVFTDTDAFSPSRLVRLSDTFSFFHVCRVRTVTSSIVHRLFAWRVSHYNRQHDSGFSLLFYRDTIVARRSFRISRFPKGQPPPPPQ